MKRRREEEVEHVLNSDNPTLKGGEQLLLGKSFENLVREHKQVFDET